MRPNRNTHPRRTGSAAIAVVIFVAAILAAAAAGAFLFLRPSVPPLPQADYAQQVREEALREAGVTEQDAARAEAALAEFYRVYKSDLAALYSPGSVQEFWPVYSDFAKLEADPKARQRFDEAVAATKASRVTDSMDRLASAAGLEPRLDPRGINDLKLRRLSFVDRLLLLEAILNNDPEAAVAAYSRALKLANVIGKPGYSRMSLLAAGGRRSNAESVILDALTGGRIDAKMARALLDATISHDFATLEQMLEGERAMLRMELIDRSRNTGRDDQSLAEAEARALEAWNAPLGKRLEASKALREWQSDEWKRSELLDERAPSYNGFLEMATYADHIHPGFHLALAIETFRLEQDSLPNSLDALVPDYLEAIPTDPMTGEPWVYRLDDESPQGYTLYAVGLDAEDNGGHQPMNPEAALNAVNGPGTDFVVIPRRPR
ncbi:MAG: hypothetical protein ACIAS6_12020 [Phycisphaerales bacterium JB060]